MHGNGWGGRFFFLLSDLTTLRGKLALLLCLINVSAMIYFRKIATTSPFCQIHSLWSRSNFSRYTRRAFFWFSFWHFCQYVWHTIYANWTSLISIFFGSFGSDLSFFPSRSPSLSFFFFLTVCMPNFGHENSLIISLIRACLLRCHYYVLLEQSPHPFNLDSKYHLHSSGEIVTSPQHVGTCADAMHAHTLKHLITVTSNKTWMMDGFVLYSRPNGNTVLSQPVFQFFALCFAR